MVELSATAADEVDAVFHALADQTRREVVQRLRGGEATVSDLAHPHPMSLAAFVKHLAVLEAAGLVLSTKRGRTRWCRLAPAALRPAEEWMRAYSELWNSRLDSLERHLEEHP
ncbi:ArsR/SmtB family transcription factor [Leifsonia sp. NPDC058230]|uniref:ArsR/SmtB family transcription factor n=1 Tax=Leifsonia sp. NPDC058230 TaxID=3346391 RepID=UPI0036DB6DA6